MKDIHFRVWHIPENKMYYRGYQKWFHALLCDDDRGQNAGRGRPVKRARYRDCIFQESTGLRDKNQKEIFEGDILRIRCEGRMVEATVPPVPDTFGSKETHPLAVLFREQGLPADPSRLELEVVGNEYETSS